MVLNRIRARELLVTGELRTLFLEALGWDRHNASLEIAVGDRSFSLHALGQKRGMVAWHCPVLGGQSLPLYAERRKIEHQVARSVHEHLIVFTDSTSDTQVWQWVKRELGRPTACREHTFHRSQPGDSLLQKLESITFSIDEEENLSLTDVTLRARAGFDVERLTRRFYDRFQKEHKAFQKLITGITERADREWYSSVLLNRLMFVYFIQRKGFLDGDRDYLRNRLIRLRAEHGKDKFYSFYRYFLLRLFHEGLGNSRRNVDLERLLGRIPYLNGGLFEVHELERPERYGKTIQIPDLAFERVFDYFDQYQWHLDERPLRADNEINPDVLGYIFEKYINQKQMGAYYTREDITEYISKNTLLPFLIDTVRVECEHQFETPAASTVWDLLKEDPDRYIYSEVQHGAEEPLPPEIVAAVNPPTIDSPVGQGAVHTSVCRRGWDRTAPATYALPTETWREVVERRGRYELTKAKLNSGEVRDTNDLIAMNLDIPQFTQDVIENCEDPELLTAFWHAIERITILDPTCGSGAFLFAALNTLEPLYEACLSRMEAFIEESARPSASHSPENFAYFRKVLGRVAAHPNRRYFIFKSIILNNLFGVDIMEEAVEICKLRLFLKLAAQVEPDPTCDNLGVEPLPDIDFNIRAGNTLIGYTTFDSVERALSSTLDFENAAERIVDSAANLQRAFDAFRKGQVEGDGTVLLEDKRELRKRLRALDDELNRYLAGDYCVSHRDKTAFGAWLKSHQPFHWLVQFYGIMTSGGFDVIIGNPPYVVYTPEKVPYEIKEGLYCTHSCKNLYAFVWERCLELAKKRSSVGLIVQLTALSSEKMTPLQNLLLRRGLLTASAFPRRPESVFDGVEMPVAILISRPGIASLYTSRVYRFYTEERPHAINVMSLAGHDERLGGHRIGKLGTALDVECFRKLDAAPDYLKSLITGTSQNFLYYQEACRYWVKACRGYPFFRRNGKPMAPPHGRTIAFRNPEASAFAVCLLNSSLFYWFYSCFSDCEHINDALIRAFRIPSTWDDGKWVTRESRLARSLASSSQRKEIRTKQGHKIEYDELDASKSKPILDEIDHALAWHYGFTERELDYITHYDIKYRMGPDTDSVEE